MKLQKFVDGAYFFHHIFFYIFNYRKKSCSKILQVKFFATTFKLGIEVPWLVWSKNKRAGRKLVFPSDTNPRK